MSDESTWVQYRAELEKSVGKQVKVRYHDGPDVKELDGTLKAINPQHMSVVIMTDKEKIMLKHIISMTRERTYKG